MLASMLLRLASPPDLRSFVEGDLHDEYCLLQMSDRARRRWYWRQALPSLLPLIGTGLRSSDWQVCWLALPVASAGQILALDFWWSFVLSQIPLKEDVVRGSGYLAASLVITLLSSGLAGTLCTLRGLILALPAAAAFSLLGLSAMRGVTPPFFTGLTLLAGAVGLWAGSLLRRRLWRLA